MLTWNIQEMTGYHPKTTLYEDFSIADGFGADAIIDTCKRAFNAWKDNTEYLTELVMVLNWKTLEHYEAGRGSYAELYNNLWTEADSWAMENLKGEDLKYYLEFNKHLQVQF